MYKKILINASLYVFSLVSTSSADYITPEDNLEIADKIYARESVVKEMRAYNITDKVVELYNQDVKIKDGITLVVDKDRCIFLYLNTEDGKKNFINQMIVEERCLNGR